MCSLGLWYRDGALQWCRCYAACTYGLLQPLPTPESRPTQCTRWTKKRFCKCTVILHKCKFIVGMEGHTDFSESRSSTSAREQAEAPVPSDPNNIVSMGYFVNVLIKGGYAREQGPQFNTCNVIRTAVQIRRSRRLVSKLSTLAVQASPYTARLSSHHRQALLQLTGPPTQVHRTKRPVGRICRKDSFTASLDRPTLNLSSRA